MKLIEIFASGFIDENGDPLVDGKVYTYETGTTTPKAVYTDEAGITPAANPVQLNSLGKAHVFGEGAYTFKVETNEDDLIETINDYQVDVSNSFIEDVQNGALMFGGATGGTANASTISLSPAIDSYENGLQVRFQATLANTADSPTLNVNALGAITMKRGDGSTLRNGDIPASGMLIGVYLGGNFYITSGLRPSWLTWTPTVTVAGGGSIASVSLSGCVYRYEMDGSITVKGKVLGTISGTVTAIILTLPVEVTVYTIEQSVAGFLYENSISQAGYFLLDQVTDKIYASKASAAAFTTGANGGCVVSGNYRV